MPLIKTDLLYGYGTTVDRDPRIEIHEDVLYVPFNHNWWSPGIYDRGRKLIIAGADFRAIPQPKPVHESYVSTIDPDTIREIIEEPLIFGCHFIQHYGHFLLSCLSRYWATETLRGKRERVLTLHSGPHDRFFSSSYIRETLGKIGLGPDDFVGFDRPVRIAKLIVPAPSFEENNIAYRAFATFANDLGDRMLGPEVPKPSDTPVYLSKSRLKSGIARIMNEGEFEHALQSRGVEIISPETLSLAQQIALFRSRRIICGGMGSAMHTSIFSPGQCLLILNHEPSVMSNQPLLDGVNRNRTTYLYPHGDIERLDACADFHVNYRLSDPKRLAGEFLRFIDAAITTNAQR